MVANKLLVSVAEVSELLGLSQPIVYQLTRRSDFPAIRLGGRVLILAELLEKWLIQQTAKSMEGGEDHA